MKVEALVTILAIAWLATPPSFASTTTSTPNEASRHNAAPTLSDDPAARIAELEARVAKLEAQRADVQSGQTRGKCVPLHRGVSCKRPGT